MGVRNRRQVERHYELRHVLRRFQSLYEDIGGRRPRRAAA
jgi:hypothetical protein